ncbi:MULTISPECIES: hypothetical protein [unclassified Pseudomonas]|jgi:hypothetical protein|uniref:DUF5983 family protein n=1 Tax=unclassified Pseudomonas TaxID=196821 RepID=UPI000778BDB0|nr:MULTISPECIES: hypothetical protein [unclassified Pseudomonas]KYC14117.1 hypothetical protein WM94_28465 [Pseudomonas sp. ABFPK]
MAQSSNPFNTAASDNAMTHPCCSRAFEIASAHLPEEDWADLQALAESADTALLQFECFTLPDSDAIGFKILSTPWTDQHLGRYWGYDLSTLQALQAAEGFSEDTVQVLTLAAQAEVRFLVIDPNSNVLNGLPLFDC